MATFPGFQVPRPVEAVVAGITPNISALGLNQDITLGSASASTWAGAYAAHQPVEVIHSTYQAVHQSALEENYYNRLWLIPGRLDLGNVVSVQERPVSVWNAHFTPRTLSQIDREDADGISLAGQPSPPLPFAALQERIWTVAVSTDGPPVVDARIVWQLQDEQPLILVITGNRITAWPFAPDWADGVQESLEWLTELLTSTSGVEQRRSLRLSPRRSFEAEFYAEGRERVLLDLSLAGWGGRIWALPVWPDIQLLASVTAAGALTVECDTRWRDFRAGGLALLRGESAFEYEVVEIQDLAASAIQLARPVQRRWPAGSRLYPIRTAQLTEQPALTRLTDTLYSAQARFLVMDSSDWLEVMPTATYRGWPVLEQRPEESEDLSLSYQRLLDVLDNETGLPQFADQAGVGFPVHGFRWQTEGREEHAALRSLLYALRGRQKAIWIPTHAADLVLVDTVAATSSVLDVELCGLARFFRSDAPGRRDIRIELFGGQVFHRRILDVSELNVDVERLAIDSALGSVVRPSDVARISFMTLCRQDSDSVQITHETDTDGISTASTVFRGVRDELQ
ncbi:MULTISPECIES: hypothetical protein [Pseudomonas]|nr:hypothetical protein [Pseudomonas aeruginosa]EIU3605429.1 hypothetical protein [Pseudomonas aeruginosa]EKT8213879.1 hypothetical protein [Pseudomonas aeruginosa]EKU8380314.1 hypothetical protein [Pseudomonas aeruginosa]EKU9195411.1 hypothetical protein [Pseudomonas aeruginosa]EKU9310600.1 hypothetical protein [Pseudomonas aeruginosa]